MTLHTASPWNLYHVKDTDRSMFVVAISFQDALERWESIIADENGLNEEEDIESPQGIDYVCGSDDLVLPLVTPGGAK